MYADSRDRPSRTLHPTSLAAAIAINAGVLAALLTAAPEWVPKKIREAIPTITVPIDPVPPPPEPAPQPSSVAPRTTPRTTAPKPLVAVPAERPFAAPSDPVIVPLPPLPLPPQPIPSVAPSPAGVFVEASVDPARAASFQPVYPSSERRAGAEGRVRVAVEIDASGRVTAVTRLEATSDAFWRATERQALTRWRFRPATRDGVAVASRREMTVRFTLE